MSFAAGSGGIDESESAAKRTGRWDSAAGRQDLAKKLVGYRGVDGDKRVAGARVKSIVVVVRQDAVEIGVREVVVIQVFTQLFVLILLGRWTGDRLFRDVFINGSTRRALTTKDLNPRRARKLRGQIRPRGARKLRSRTRPEVQRMARRANARTSGAPKTLKPSATKPRRWQQKAASTNKRPIWS